MGPLGRFERLAPGPQRIVEREERVHVRLAVQPFDGRDEGSAAGCDEAGSIGYPRAVLQFDGMAFGIKGNRLAGRPEQRLDAHPLVEAVLSKPHAILGGLALDQIRDERAAVRGMGLVAHDGDGAFGVDAADGLRSRHARCGIADDQVVGCPARHASSPRFPRR